MYDQETRSTDTRHKRETDSLRHSNGQHNLVHLRFGYGGRLSSRPVGKTSGQSRNFQNAFTRFFYSYRRHDWIPVWYQTDGR